MGYIQAKSLAKHYGRGESKVAAITDISFQIELGDFVGIMGPSGAGKSTLLSIMGAMNTPSSGSFRIDDLDVYSLTQEQRADFRREFLGFIFQSFHLITYLTVIENVMLPLTALKMPRHQKQTMAREALDAVGLKDKALRLPGQISGGEKERVAIARAIVNEPPVLLADEPTGNLDTKTSREIMELLQTLNSDGMTIVMVTHSPQCAGYAERILQVADGLLISEVASQDLISACMPSEGIAVPLATGRQSPI